MNPLLLSELVETLFTVMEDLAPATACVNDCLRHVRLMGTELENPT